MSAQNEVFLGDQVKCKMTGLKGIVVGRTQWLYGCVRITIQPTGLKDGKPAEQYTGDEPQFDIIKRITKESPKPPSGGGPRSGEKNALSRY